MTESKQTANGPLHELFSLAQIQHLMRVEFSRALRYDYPLVCLFVAVDQLDSVRDRFGFEARETVLGAVVDLLHERTRTSDFLGRLPDDRLMIVVPHSTPEQIEIMAVRLVERATELSLPEIEGEHLSFSIGGSWLTAGETMFHDDLIKTAERCAQEASAAGGGKYIARAPEGQL
ncbi:MAG: GGDEF domain-containing protein [bacterium]|jgi:diguanylate cyclase (GGDEF)-like protein|nr:GGDEF domain-containing protein [Planctomycetota bacterium]HIL53375.1 GGDEF domain-containing protein [Planctomycetota bacterium]